MQQEAEMLWVFFAFLFKPLARRGQIYCKKLIRNAHVHLIYRRHMKEGRGKGGVVGRQPSFCFFRSPVSWLWLWASVSPTTLSTNKPGHVGSHWNYFRLIFESEAMQTREHQREGAFCCCCFCCCCCIVSEIHPNSSSSSLFFLLYTISFKPINLNYSNWMNLFLSQIIQFPTRLISRIRGTKNNFKRQFRYK